MNRYLKSILAKPYLIVAAMAVLLASPSIHAKIKNIYDSGEGDVAGITSLMSAVTSNDVAGVKFFSRAGGALVNQKNIGGATALHLACREGNFEIIQILVDNGADINAVDNEGWTPLMRASLAAKRDAVDLLLTQGAKASMLNSIGETAIIHAASSDCNSCMSLMFEKFNFVEAMDVDILKAELADAFVVARNRSNQIAQDMIAAYLDRVAQISPLITKRKKAEADRLKKLIAQERSENDAKFTLRKNSGPVEPKGKFVQQELPSKIEKKKEEKHFIVTKPKVVEKVVEVDMSPVIQPERVYRSRYRLIVGEQGKLRKKYVPKKTTSKKVVKKAAKKFRAVSKANSNGVNKIGVVIIKPKSDIILEDVNVTEVEIIKPQYGKVLYKLNKGPAGKKLIRKQRVKKKVIQKAVISKPVAVVETKSKLIKKPTVPSANTDVKSADQPKSVNSK